VVRREEHHTGQDFVVRYIDPLIVFVSHHAWLAYVTLFLAALLEAVPVVGSFIPGSTLILALSALVPGGELKLQWVQLPAFSLTVITSWLV
jgi:membrane-associated protein